MFLHHSFLFGWWNLCLVGFEVFLLGLVSVFQGMLRPPQESIAILQAPKLKIPKTGVKHGHGSKPKHASDLENLDSL